MNILKKNITISILFIFSAGLFSMNLKETKDNKGQELTLVIIQKSPSASDKLDGKVSIEVKGGKAPYTLILHTSTRTTSQEFKGEKFEFENLPNGFYLFNVSDADGNFVSKNINL